MGIETDREEFRRMTARAALAPMDAVRDLTVPGGDGPIRARMLVPQEAGDTGLVCVHGGGWYLGDLDGWEPIARVIAQTTRCPLLEIEHRQAARAPVPRPVRRRQGGADRGRGRARRAARRRDRRQLRRQPRHGGRPARRRSRDPGPRVSGGRPRGDANRRPRPAAAPRATATSARPTPADPDVSPLLAPDVAGLPPAVVCVAEDDWLRVQGLAYAQRLQPTLLDRVVMIC